MFLMDLDRHYAYTVFLKIIGVSMVKRFLDFGCLPTEVFLC